MRPRCGGSKFHGRADAPHFGSCTRPRSAFDHRRPRVAGRCAAQTQLAWRRRKEEDGTKLVMCPASTSSATVSATEPVPAKYLKLRA